MDTTEIIFQREFTLAASEFINVLQRSTLAERRPVADAERIADMLQHANLIVTARMDGRLIGVSRALTDFAFCTYLSDLAVDETYQHQGIGARLIYETKKHSPQAKLILLAAPKATGYYPKVGMSLFEHCFILDDAEKMILKQV